MKRTLTPEETQKIRDQFGGPYPENREAYLQNAVETIDFLTSSHQELQRRNDILFGHIKKYADNPYEVPAVEALLNATLVTTTDAGLPTPFHIPIENASDVLGQVSEVRDLEESGG